MSKSRFFVLLSFCLAFAAGAAVGVMLSREDDSPGETDAAERERDSWLARRLDLTPEQSEKIRQIWSELMPSRRDLWSGRRALRRKRDEAIRDLLTEEQKEQYDQIVQEYEEKTQALAEERRERFEQAVERTRAILSPEQRARYDTMLEERHGRRGRSDRDGRRRGDRSDRDGNESNASASE